MKLKDILSRLRFQKAPERAVEPAVTNAAPPEPPTLWVRSSDLLDALEARIAALEVYSLQTDSQALRVKLSARADENRDWVKFIKEREEA